MSNDFKISKTAQLRAISSPIRQEILDTVNALGICSIPEIAEALDRPADSLYYHIRALLKAKLLLDAGTRRKKRHTEALVKAPTERVMRLEYKLGDVQNATAIAKIVRGMLRVAERDFATGLHHSQAQGDSDQRNLNASRQKGWLTQDELREVNEHLLRLQEIFHGAQRRDDTTFCSLTFVMAPVEQTKAADS